MTDPIDDLLAGLVSEGWDSPPGEPATAPPRPDQAPPLATPPPAVPERAVARAEYPPLPVREVDPEPISRPVAVVRPPAEDEPEEGLPARAHNRLGVGAVAGLAAGQLTSSEVTALTGVSDEDLQDSLALALRELSPEDIAKAMSLQATEQQLKSGAMYGVVLADLMKDLATGRMKVEDKIKIATMLGKIGRLEPKEDRNAAVGGGFVLNINMGAATTPVTIENEG